MTPTQTNDLLDAVAKVLMWCFVLGFLLLLIWTAAYVLADDLIYRLHGKMFRLAKHELDLIHYCGIAFVKACVLVFFFFPWVAIRLVLKRRRA